MSIRAVSIHLLDGTVLPPLPVSSKTTVTVLLEAVMTQNGWGGIPHLGLFEWYPPCRLEPLGDESIHLQPLLKRWMRSSPVPRLVLALREIVPGPLPRHDCCCVQIEPN
jgi:hypothetical protein